MELMDLTLLFKITFENHEIPEVEDSVEKLAFKELPVGKKLLGV